MELEWTNISVTCVHCCKSWTFNCTSTYIVRAISRISTSATDGSYWILSEVRSFFSRRTCALLVALEFVYDDIFLVWETIAAARRTVSKRFVLFIALAMLKSYRDIILDNRMDFTDIIRFFNGRLISFLCSISGA